MKEEKLKQLRIIFENVIKKTIKDVPNVWNIHSSPNTYAEETANQLVYEVKIRINNN